MAEVRSALVACSGQHRQTDRRRRTRERGWAHGELARASKLWGRRCACACCGISAKLGGSSGQDGRRKWNLAAIADVAGTRAQRDEIRSWTDASDRIYVIMLGSDYLLSGEAQVPRLPQRPRPPSPQYLRVLGQGCQSLGGTWSPCCWTDCVTQCGFMARQGSISNARQPRERQLEQLHTRSNS